MTKNRIVFFALGLAALNLHAADIRHRFLAMDESRSQLHYVDQFDSSKDWTLKLPGGCRDVQLLGNQRVLISTPDGYAEYDLRIRKKVKMLADSKYGNTETAVRLPNGHTILGGNVRKDGGAGVQLTELDAEDRPVREAFFPQVRDLRLIRLAADGSFLFGADKLVVRAEWDGSVRTFPIAEDKRHVYEVRELPNGNYCVSSGYGATLEEWTADGTFVRKIGVGENTDDLFFLFFSGTQPLPDGHWVVCNWTGHGQDDSRKGPQLVEFDSQGRVVWIWHDPERAGTIHGVGILD